MGCSCLQLVSLFRAILLLPPRVGPRFGVVCQRTPYGVLKCFLYLLFAASLRGFVACPFSVGARRERGTRASFCTADLRTFSVIFRCVVVSNAGGQRSFGPGMTSQWSSRLVSPQPQSCYWSQFELLFCSMRKTQIRRRNRPYGRLSTIAGARFETFVLLTVVVLSQYLWSSLLG